MTNLKNAKKDFAKIVKVYRDGKPDVERWDNWNKKTVMVRPEFPKAMMTSQQMENGTATINFGWKGQEEANKFLTYEPFTTWCESYGARIKGVELNPDGRYQVRVNY